MGDEAEHLESQSDYGAADDMRERDEQAYYDSLNKKQKRYFDNKRAQLGTTICCANCNRKILKKNYQAQFCSNKGRGNCKDTYWNNVSDERRDRAQIFAR